MELVTALFPSPAISSGSGPAHVSPFMMEYEMNYLGMARALLGGTTAMRAAGETYLPKFPRELDSQWERRLDHATLYPAYEYTTQTLASKPFSEDLTFSEDMPDELKNLLDDIDAEGRNLHAFGHDAFEVTVGRGFGGILVDYLPAEDVPTGPTGARTVKQEREAGLRPYFVHYYPEQILGWRWERKAGKRVLTMLRLLEAIEQPDGEFGTTQVLYVRVFTPGAFELYRINEGKDKSQFQLEKRGRITVQGIPFVPLYGKRLGFMQPTLPLRDLAHLNIKHWQSQSDQDTILHVARVPMLAFSGVDDNFSVDVGASTAVNLPAGAEGRFIEHSGAAIGAGRQSLEDLKEEMRQSGASMLVMQPGRLTATQVENEASPALSQLQRMSLNMEDAMNTALQIAADFMGLETGGSVKLFHDHGLANMAQAESQLILSAKGERVISSETAFDELKRRKIISTDRDWDEERELIDSEGPMIGEPGNPLGNVGTGGTSQEGESQPGPNDYEDSLAAMKDFLSGVSFDKPGDWRKAALPEEAD